MKYANYMGTIIGFDTENREAKIDFNILANTYEEALVCMDIINLEQGIEDYEAEFYEYIETVTSNVDLPVPYIDN
tara:strand:+ start:609 stop:833 length:225 start_codon:yes stop_codon:yes gene_type:complete